LLRFAEESMQERGVACSAANHFHALWSLLDDPDRELQMGLGQSQAIEHNVALVQLLSRVFPSLECAVVRDCYSKIYTVLRHSLSRFRQCPEFVSPALDCLRWTLAAFSDKPSSFWIKDKPSLLELFAEALDSMCHPSVMVSNHALLIATQIIVHFEQHR